LQSKHGEQVGPDEAGQDPHFAGKTRVLFFSGFGAIGLEIRAYCEDERVEITSEKGYSCSCGHSVGVGGVGCEALGVDDEEDIKIRGAAFLSVGTKVSRVDWLGLALLSINGRDR
jgi:hypothetical protein